MSEVREDEEECSRGQITEQDLFHGIASLWSVLSIKGCHWTYITFIQCSDSMRIDSRGGKEWK